MTDDEPYDAHETAKPDEPTFTVQGGDPIGYHTVQYWADAARGLARAILNGRHVHFEPTEADPEYTPTAQDMAAADSWLRKATSAEAKGWDMRAYLKGQFEAPQAVRATYSGEAAAEVDPDLDLRRSRIVRSSQLNNAVAIVHEVAEALAAWRLLPEAEVRLRESVEAIKLTALELDPRKGNERS